MAKASPHGLRKEPTAPAAGRYPPPRRTPVRSRGGLRPVASRRSPTLRRGSPGRNGRTAIGQPTEAVTLLLQALKIDPKATVCEMRLALAYLALGQTAPAEAHLRKLLARLPTYHEAWDNLGMVLKSAGRIEEALAAHRRSVELQPRYSQGWYNLGMANALLGRGAAALACHEHALSADPQHGRARYGRAQGLAGAASDRRGRRRLRGPADPPP
jgi:tetratricopeptide (TPR) repeat protein